MIHNRHKYYGGEDRIYESSIDALRLRGNRVFLYEKSSRNISDLKDKIMAFLSGIYSPSSRSAISRILSIERPDVANIFNLYPLISPSVLIACSDFKVPAVVRCADFRLLCPTSWFFNGDEICKRCSYGKEYWCIIKNCRGNWLESIGYSLRTMVARKLDLFQKRVAMFVTPSNLVKDKLVDAGFTKERIFVIPNMISIPDAQADPLNGEYIAFVGRISAEKGINTLLDAANQRPELPIRLAGDGVLLPRVAENSPKNIRFEGALNRTELSAFYRKARFLVIPSVCLESFGIVAAEAMSFGLPVIASKIGALPDNIEDGITGLLFDHRNSTELAEKMHFLWNNPLLCKQMGKAARQKAILEYNEDVYYKRLMSVYDRAIEINNL